MTRNKYHASKTELDGIRFDSRKEAARYRELKLLERAGEIRDLQLQVPFELIPKQEGERACTYVADFVYHMTDTGKMVVEDAKGMRTDVYKIKRKLMLWRHGIRISEV